MLSPSRWHAITESSFPWEKDALQFVRERLPDRDPFHAWTNFEFLADDGSVNEVDLLVLAPGGFFLVEIKSRPGTLSGDQQTWIWTDQGREAFTDNPLFLANRKAKRLAALLRRQRAMNRQRLPFIEPLIFCSAPGLTVRLAGPAATGVRVRDKDTPSGRHDETPGIIAELSRQALPDGVRIDSPIARIIHRAVEQAGIRRSQRSERIGDYELVRSLREGPAYQDYEAHHVALTNVVRRVRIYQIPHGASAETRQMIVRAAQREFQILEGIDHPGILKPVEYKDHERGPALVFEHRADASTLDHFLRQPRPQLTALDRATLLRELAEAVKYAHDRHLVHRALSPHSVLVLDAESPRRRLQIFNWQVGARESGTTAGRSVTATSHVEQLVEEGATVYLAPESLVAAAEAGEYVDVFSLGAIAYHLFTGQPPAESLADLGEKLRQRRGLQVSDVMNGAGGQLQDLVAFATHPDVATRLENVQDFLDLIDLLERELREGQEPAIVRNPTEATPGDEVAPGLTIVSRIGQGSTSVVFLVKDATGRELVLKVAASPEHSDRLRQEGDVLARIRHQHIVAAHRTLEIGGHTALLMDRAGETTLAQRLRTLGPLHLELLQRFGEDLLQTVIWLEQQGIPHRDIKPANIGVAEVGRGNRLHLVLFDFSLSRSSLEAIRAGTVPYLDPFLGLRRPRRWDNAAERFAAAVTLYEMATGSLPRWGDGRSDPAVIEDEATIDAARFDPDLRERMSAFFTQALRRDPAQRFDNADEMLVAWRRVFTGVAEPRHEIEVPVVDAVDITAAVAQAAADTPIGHLGLSTRALNALERQRVATAGELVALPSRLLYAMAGVGSKTRREIHAAKSALQARFGSRTHPLTATTGTSTDGGPEAFSIDQLASRLIPRRSRGDATAELRILTRFLGTGLGDTSELWPTQTAVAGDLGITRARVSQVVGQARGRWLRDTSLTRVRDDIDRLIRTQGGVMTSRELTLALLALRGSDQEEPVRSRRAVAVARATIETESDRTEPRFAEYRRGPVVLLASSEDCADFAHQLGRVADSLAELDPLPSPARVLEDLQKVDPPAGVTGLTPSRTVLLAAAASETAASSSRLELYPRGMPAERALLLAQNALLGTRHLTVKDLRDRVAGRFPEAEPLPDRPALDDLLQRVEIDLVWSADAAGGRGAYASRHSDTFGVSSSTTFRTRPAAEEERYVPEDVARFEERLRASLKQRAFLALAVTPRYLKSAERRLATRFPVDSVSLEQLMIEQMKRAASAAGADWNIVRRADAEGPAGPQWRNLLLLVGRALPEVERAVLESGKPVLLGHPGLFARYGRMDFFNTLQQNVGRPGGPPGAWVLIPSDAQQALPVIDGETLPVIAATAWARVPDAWVQEAS